MARTKNFAEVIRKKLAANPDLAEAVDTESFNADIAMKVYDARTAVGLTQKQLAERVGTKQSVISRIEDADYDGHSLKLLKRIANALHLKLGLEFYGRAVQEEARPAASSKSVRYGEDKFSTTTGSSARTEQIIQEVA